MKIYIAHSRGFDYKKDLYEPIKQSALNKEHTFILPHEKSDELFDSKELLRNDCDLVIAEVSYPSTGVGIELGWANAFGVPIVCFYRKDFKPSESLRSVSKEFVEYNDVKELISEIDKIIKRK
jgi:nucleoside 2-deoxyribosyltransferase